MQRLARSEFEHFYRLDRPRGAGTPSGPFVHGDWQRLHGEKVIGSAPSGSGLQISLSGLLGLTASPVEGLEVNVLGLTLGVNPFDFSLKLPLVGRIGFAREIAIKQIEARDQSKQPEPVDNR